MISLILPNYCPDREVEEYLMKFLDTLEANTDRSKCEFIVVENGSYTPRLMERADLYLYHKDPLGYAKAVNYGLKIAKGDMFVIMNNDLEVPPGWLETMLEEYEGGTLAPMDFPAEPIMYENSHWFSLVMFDRHVLDTIGLLDEDLLNYRFHDQEYSIKVRRAGLPVRRTGKVTVKHTMSTTYKKMGRNEDPAEREEMIRRYGVSHFGDWCRDNL